MSSKSFRRSVVATGFLATVFGCQSTGLLMMPVNVGSGNGRVDRVYEEPLSRVVPALFRAMDAQSIRPVALSFRDDAFEQAIDIEGADEARRNSDLMKDSKVLETDVIDMPDDKSRPFKVGLAAYRGYNRDGSRVLVIARSVEKGTKVAARIGVIGSEAKGTALLDGLTASLQEAWIEKPPEPAKPKLQPFRRTLPPE